MTDKEKLIKGLMNCGLSREDATSRAEAVEKARNCDHEYKFEVGSNTGTCVKCGQVTVQDTPSIDPRELFQRVQDDYLYDSPDDIDLAQISDDD